MKARNNKFRQLCSFREEQGNCTVGTDIIKVTSVGKLKTHSNVLTTVCRILQSLLVPWNYFVSMEL